MKIEDLKPAPGSKREKEDRSWNWFRSWKDLNKGSQRSEGSFRRYEGTWI